METFEDEVDGLELCTGTVLEPRIKVTGAGEFEAKLFEIGAGDDWLVEEIGTGLGTCEIVGVIWIVYEEGLKNTFDITKRLY